MLYRRLPLSDDSRNIALTEAKTKKDNTPNANLILRDETIVRLDAMQPLLDEAMQKRAVALQQQATITEQALVAREKAKLFIRHFLRGFNAGVERELFTAENRAFYQLDVNSKRVPRMINEAEVLTWGEHVIEGDAARVAAGGAAMGFPDINEVADVYNDFLTKHTEKSNKKDAYDRAQEVVEKMRKEVDKLIRRIWDEVETSYNDEEISSIRRKARSWGVVYVARAEKKKQQESNKEQGL